MEKYQMNRSGYRAYPNRCGCAKPCGEGQGRQMERRDACRPAPTPGPGCGCRPAPRPEPGCGCRPTPKPEPGCGCRPVPKPEPGCGCRPVPKPEPGCGCHHTHRADTPQHKHTAEQMESSGGCHGQNPLPDMYHQVDQMVPAMGYVPLQQWQQPYDLSYALQMGTIFPALCKPFCGRREACRC